MVTFFNILFILLGLNALLLIFSVNRTSKKAKKPVRRITETPLARIYPVDLIPSKYKKAI